MVWRTVIILSILCWNGLLLQAQPRDVSFGVVMERGEIGCLERWNPTADYLSRTLRNVHDMTTYVERVVIEPVEYQNVADVLNKQMVDFLFLNFSQYRQYEDECHLTPLAMVELACESHVIKSEGSVTFTLSNRTEITSVQDIKGQRIMAVDRDSLGGWRAALRECISQGMDPQLECRKIRFGGSHTAVAEGIIEGQADIGIIPTCALELLAKKGIVTSACIRTFALTEACPDLPVKVSTRVYPQWVVVALPRVPEVLKKSMAAALISMPDNTDAAKAAEYKTWTIVTYDTRVDDLLEDIGITDTKINTNAAIERFKQALITAFFVALILFGVLVLGVIIAVRVRRSIEAARQEVRHANVLKGQFLANISHEIRTPMNGILGMTELTLDTELTDEQRHSLTMVQHSAKTLLDIINDILDFSKIQTGALELKPRPHNIYATVDTVMRVLGMRAHAHGISLSYFIYPSVPRMIVADAERIRQLIVNIVGNAIKFTHEGYVEMHLQCIETEDETAKLKMVVTDTGIGIALNNREKIFDAFRQSDGAATREYGGAGLGLAISQQIVTLMNGHIDVESTPGEGSTFTVEFNVQLDTDASEQPAMLLPEDDAAKIHCIIIDNDEHNASIVSTYCEESNIEVSTVTTLEEGAEKISDAKDDTDTICIVCVYDEMLPTGTTAEKYFEKNVNEENTPVYIRMGYITHEDGEEDFYHVHKPVSRRDFIEVVSRIIRKEEMQEESSEKTRQRTQAAAHKESALRVLLAEDNKVNQMLAKSMLEREGHIVDVASDGKEAVQKWIDTEYDIILMDIQMPEMGGVEATQCIREDEKGSRHHIPIVALTAHAMAGDKEKYLSQGMDGYISKPIDKEELRTTLSELTNTQKTKETAMEDKAQDMTEKRLFDKEELLERVAGDEDLMMELIGLFRVDIETLLADLETGIATRDDEKVRHAAHTIKGMSGNLSAHSLYETSYELELAGKNSETDKITEKFEEVKDICNKLEVYLQTITGK